MKYWHGELKLKELRLTNFRQFEALNIAFHEKMTVFIGENGSGKTTVLEAVDKAMRLFSTRMERADSDIDIRDFFFTSDIKNDVDSSKVELLADVKVDDGTVFEKIERDRESRRDKLREIDLIIQSYYEEADREIEKYRTLYENNQELFKSNVERVVEYRDELVRLQKVKQEQQIVHESQENKHKEEQEALKPDEVYWNISIDRDIRKKGDFSQMNQIEAFGETLLRAKRTVLDVSTPFFKYYPCRDLDNTPVSETIKGKTSLLDEEHTSIEAFTTWYRRVERQSAEKNDFQLLHAIQNAIYELLSDGESHKFDNLRLSYLNEEKPDGELWINKNGRPLRLNQLSSGETMLFLLVSDLTRRFVQANPRSTAPEKTGSAVILIDEVDLHLHPQWQIKVLGKLSSIFPKAQFLVTTHSPLVITHLDPEKSKVGLLKDIAERTPIQWLENYAGRTLEDFIYAFYGIKKRPEKMQEQLDDLFDLINQGKIKQAQKKLTILKKQLGESDAAVLDAESLIEFS